jgi:GrpB-like predicted nucleotidyltransferase (UPF0157 family)
MLFISKRLLIQLLQINRHHGKLPVDLSLKFRNYMRAHPEDAQAYCATKQEAVAKGNAKGEDYQEVKTPFLAAISAKLQRAL